MKKILSVQSVLFAVLFCCLNLTAATRYRIDINEAANPVTCTNGTWTALDAASDGSGSVTVDGVTFTLFGAQSSLNRGDSEDTDPDALRVDFIYANNLDDRLIGVELGGAGALQQGLWEAKVYIYDRSYDASRLGDQEILYRINEQEQILSSCAVQDNISIPSPAYTFTFYSDGISAYDIGVRGNNEFYHCRLCGIELRLLEYKIDINNADNSVTNAGWHGLDARPTGSGDFVDIDGVRFKTFSADGARLRGTAQSPNPDALLGDFVFDDGATNAAVGLFFGSTNDLPYAAWQADLYFWDVNASVPVFLDVGLRWNRSGDIIVGSDVPASATGPAFSHLFQSDGYSAVDMFTRTLTDEHASYLNAVHLRALDDRPKAPALLRYDMNDASSDVTSESGSQSGTESADFISDHISASTIGSVTNFGVDVPPANRNLARNSRDGSTWWVRSSLTPYSHSTNDTMFLEFTCAPRPGYKVNMQNGELRVRVGLGNWAGGVFQSTMYLYHNDAGNLALLDSRSSHTVSYIKQNPIYRDLIFDVAELDIVDSPVTLRLYFTDQSGVNGKAINIDTLTLYGEIVLPPPGTIFLVR
jgi:hypothetical protein